MEELAFKLLDLYVKASGKPLEVDELMDAYFKILARLQNKELELKKIEQSEREKGEVEHVEFVKPEQEGEIQEVEI